MLCILQMANAVCTARYTMFTATWCYSECCVPSGFNFEPTGDSVVRCCSSNYLDQGHRVTVNMTWALCRVKSGNTRKSTHPRPICQTCKPHPGNGVMEGNQQFLGRASTYVSVQTGAPPFARLWYFKISIFSLSLSLTKKEMTEGGLDVT